MLPMKKHVYLFELDSVRNTDAEIEIGQKALYNEIVCNGNTVVLTFNQLVDSRGFFSLFNKPEYYDSIVALFKSGAICISQYGDNRTVSQYLLSSFDYEKEFIYSGWPLKSTQKRLLALIKRSLTYSDLSEINDYCTGKKTEQEIKDLFFEVDDKTVDDKAVDDKNEIDVENCLRILKKLYWLLKVVLQLSTDHTIYIAPRNTAEYANQKLSNILSIIAELDCVKTDDKLRSAMHIIESLSCYKSEDRSKYLHCLLDESGKYEKGSRRDYQYAEAIVNLAYNYACEISICNISKHYDIDELTLNRTERISFEADFLNRLNQYLEIGDFDNRFLLEETNDYIEFIPSKGFPDFLKAVRLNSYVSNDLQICQQKGIPRYVNKSSKNGQ